MTTTAPARELLTVDEVALELRCSVATVRRRIRDGTLPAVQLAGAGHLVRVPRAALVGVLHDGVELRTAVQPPDDQETR